MRGEIQDREYESTEKVQQRDEVQSAAGTEGADDRFQESMMEKDSSPVSVLRFLKSGKYGPAEIREFLKWWKELTEEEKHSYTEDVKMIYSKTGGAK